MPAASFVIDASVAVKWFSLEPGRRQAIKILKKLEKGKWELLAPEILLYEVVNALWKGKRLEIKDIKKAIDDLSEIGIQLQQLNKFLAHQAIEFMVKYNLTFYDAVYGALAFLSNIPLISANPKHHKKIKEIKVLALDKVKN